MAPFAYNLKGYSNLTKKNSVSEAKADFSFIFELKRHLSNQIGVLQLFTLNLILYSSIGTNQG